jgi:hypothetical protein
MEIHSILTHPTAQQEFAVSAYHESFKFYLKRSFSKNVADMAFTFNILRVGPCYPTPQCATDAAILLL